MRTWGNYRFEWTALIRPELDELGIVQAFQPHAEYANPQDLPLHPHGEGPFCRFRIPPNHQDGGLYLLLVDDKPVYLGECASLATRFNRGYGAIAPRDCYEGGRPEYCRINHLIFAATRAGCQVEIWFSKMGKRRAAAADLAKTLRPTWNQANFTAEKL